jgi:hypothetical protein
MNADDFPFWAIDAREYPPGEPQPFESFEELESFAERIGFGEILREMQEGIDRARPNATAS